MRARMSVEHAGQLATVKAELAATQSQLAETTSRPRSLRHIGDQHASPLHAAAAATDHPALQTVELTSLLHPAKRPRS